MTEKRLLQIAIAIAGLIPVTAGMWGGLRGIAMLGYWGDAAVDSHFRYLSGLLLAIGVAYWTTIPDIERQGARISLLTLIIVTGGFFRAFGMLADGSPGPIMTAALVVELAVTPLLYLWQLRIARDVSGRAQSMDAKPAAR
jgi:Flp pilus assembly protein TadB